MRIVIIGAGNIATHLAKGFHSLGHEISQVYNRTSANAKALADVVSSQAIDEINQIITNADLYIIAVSDSSIAVIIDQLCADLNGIVVHTSGATPLSILSKFHNSGVIYPPQSLNKNIDYNLSAIPFAIEGSDATVSHDLLTLMQSLSMRSFLCNTQQRMALHVSAVFANNFTNALFIIANSILEKEDLSFDLIKPIILETAQKVQNNSPAQVQTGPAIRNDKTTIESHLEFLSYSNNLSEIYQLMTNLIIKRGYK